MMRSTIRLETDSALLFDMDGTLVDSTMVDEQLWFDWANRHGLDYASVIKIAHGRRDVDVIREVAPWLRVQDETAWILEQELARADAIKEVPGARALISHLDPRQWAVVTSSSRELARKRLTAAGLSVPAIMVTSEDVSAGKPDPQGYLVAAKRLGCNIKTSVVFEDTMAGLTAGRRAGAITILVKATRQSQRIDWPDSVESYHDVEFRPGRLSLIVD